MNKYDTFTDAAGAILQHGHCFRKARETAFIWKHGTVKGEET